MNAETLGALATIVNEAIAKAVQPLQQRVAELEGRKYATPDDVGAAEQAIHDRARTLEARVKELEGRPTEIVAPAVTPEQLEELRKAWRETDERVKLLAEPAPAYDDSELREQIKTLESSHAKDVEALLQRTPKAYDDQPLQTRLDELEKAASDWGDMRSAFDNHVQSVERQLKAALKPQDGRDALALEVLPEIDQAKSYVRNTYAKHNGGLWRSFEQTHGMRGWEVIVDGVHAVMPVLEGKSLTVRVIQSSGTESVLMADLPIQEYKGVFRPEGEYTAHDTATWAGSLWHCNVTGTKAKPGDGSSDWTLAVKKGRDARESVKIGGA